MSRKRNLLLATVSLFVSGQAHAQNNLILNTPVSSPQTAGARLDVKLQPGFSVNAAGIGGTFIAQVDFNLNGVSDFLESQAAATPTYFTSFETFAAGNINNQGGWFGGPSAPQVAVDDAYDGVRSISIAGGATTNSLVRYFNPIPGQTVTFVDFAARPTANTTAENSTFFDLGGSRIAFLNSGGNGQVQVFNGNGSGGGSWTAITGPFVLGPNSQSTAWIRFTVRIDYTNKKWDLYLDGKLVAYELGFVSNGFTYLSSLWIYGSTAGPTQFDFPYVSSTNPLFEDNDRDGMDDAWETANGLNPANAADRTTNLDGDAYINIEEFKRATPANSSSSTPTTFEVFTPLQ